MYVATSRVCEPEVRPKLGRASLSTYSIVVESVRKSIHRNVKQTLLNSNFWSRRYIPKRVRGVPRLSVCRHWTMSSPSEWVVLSEIIHCCWLQYVLCRGRFRQWELWRFRVSSISWVLADALSFFLSFFLLRWNSVHYSVVTKSEPLFSSHCTAIYHTSLNSVALMEFEKSLGDQCFQDHLAQHWSNNLAIKFSSFLAIIV